jgi:hypothetical protein
VSAAGIAGTVVEIAGGVMDTATATGANRPAPRGIAKLRGETLISGVGTGTSGLHREPREVPGHRTCVCEDKRDGAPSWHMLT